MQLISNHLHQEETYSSVAYSLSVIVPVFKEQQVLPHFLQTLCAVMEKMPNERVQIIYVNDGSWLIIKGLRSTSADICRLNATFTR